MSSRDKLQPGDYVAWIYSRDFVGKIYARYRNAVCISWTAYRGIHHPDDLVSITKEEYEQKVLEHELQR